MKDFLILTLAVFVGNMLSQGSQSLYFYFKYRNRPTLSLRSKSAPVDMEKYKAEAIKVENEKMVAMLNDPKVIAGYRNLFKEQTKEDWQE